MFQNDCTLPLSADLFAQAVHPTEPFLTVGLSSGHVECFRLPSEAPSSSSDSSDGRGHIASAWRTKRHKGSCRALAFSPDGSHCYSAGTDSLLKQFSPETGQVIAKVRVSPSLPTRGQPDQPSLLHALSDQTLLLACDSGAIHMYDLRAGTGATPSPRPAQIHIAHDDYVSSITPLPGLDQAGSAMPRQFVSTGGTTLAVIDMRRGLMAKSEHQEDELLCSAFVPGLGPKKNRNNGVLAVGGSSGVLTLWDRGSWDDQQDRIYVNRLESIDALALVPDSKRLVAAVGNGHLAVVDMQTREMERTLNHDDEGAVALSFDCMGRMISGGGKIVKIWEDIAVATWEDAEDDDSNEDGDDDGEGVSKRKRGSDEEQEEEDEEEEKEEEEDDSSEEERPKKKKKNKKKKRGTPGVGVYGHHGVMGFPGL